VTSRLPLRSVAKPWGREVLPAPFAAAPGECIGEVWFEPPPALSRLLAKYIFTSEQLSVQVHPAGVNGKDECWLVIDADADARLGVGFSREIDHAAIRAAALDGSIEGLLDWHPVRPGDFFYIPAGTVHAIGAGVGLIEVQQNSDITYRLYDYGRPRELHLDEGLAAASGKPHDPALRRHLPQQGCLSLVDGPYFRLDRIDGAPDSETAARYAGGPLLVIPRKGEVSLSGELIAPGECAMAESLADIGFASGSLCLIAQPCGA
jgi:mannose-6-phosphate isomerase